MAARNTTSSTTPEPEPTPQPAATTPPPVQQSPSVLGRLRGNRMGAVLGGLVVALVVGALLSVLVPDSQLLLALALLGLGEAAAVGFTVRYLSECRGLKTQLTAFVLTVIGVHVLATTGIVNQKIGEIGDIARVLGDGIGWDDALLGALATPAASTGAVVCGLIAAIIAGWGPRSDGHGRYTDAAV